MAKWVFVLLLVAAAHAEPSERASRFSFGGIDAKGRLVEEEFVCEPFPQSGGLLVVIPRTFEQRVPLAQGVVAHFHSRWFPDYQILLRRAKADPGVNAQKQFLADYAGARFNERFVIPAAVDSVAIEILEARFDPTEPAALEKVTRHIVTRRDTRFIVDLVSPKETALRTGIRTLAQRAAAELNLIAKSKYPELFMKHLQSGEPTPADDPASAALDKQLYLWGAQTSYAMGVLDEFLGRNGLLIVEAGSGSERALPKGRLRDAEVTAFLRARNEGAPAR